MRLTANRITEDTTLVHDKVVQSAIRKDKSRNCGLEPEADDRRHWRPLLAYVGTVNYSLEC